MKRTWLLGLLACGCEQDPRTPFDLDRIAEPTEECVTVIHEALEPGLALHEYLADAPSSRGGWALVTMLDELDEPALAVVRIPAAPDEPATPTVWLGESNLGAVQVQLRGGVLPGELWVLQDSAAGAWLRELAPGIGVVAGNGSIANFPIANGGGGCPQQFDRQLLLLDGRPFVLAIPDCGDSMELDLELLELDPSSLVFASAWRLSFDPCLDDPNCALPFPYRLDPIGSGESTSIAGAERIAVGFSKVRDFGNGLTVADVSLLELWLEAGAPNAHVLTFEEVWALPTELGPVALAQDPFSIQLHVRNQGSGHDAALLRFAVVDKFHAVLIKHPQLPLGGRGQLVQLATQSAMIDVDQGTLEAVPLIDVADWPIWEPRPLLELEDLVGFEPAGAGQLLLRRELAPAQIVQLRCLSEPA